MPGPAWLAGNDPDLNNPLAKFIQLQEGWHAGSVSQRHNNPGNLKFNHQPGAAVGEAAPDGGNFAQFPDYKTGLAALNKQIQLDASRGLSFRDFAKKYAPGGGTNDPEKYAKDLAASTGHAPDDPISNVQQPPAGRPTWLAGAKGQPAHTQTLTGTPVVPPSPTFGYIGNVLHRGVDGALRTVGLPPVGDPSYSNPLRLSDAAAALNPYNILKGLSDTQLSEAQKGADALRKVGTAQGIVAKAGAGVSALGHGIATLLPPLAPIAEGQDRTAAGDIAGGLTEGVVGASGGELLNKGLGAATDAVGRISGKTPIPSDPVTGATSVAEPPVPTPEEANFQKSAKLFKEAAKPGPAGPKLEDALRTALPEYNSFATKENPVSIKNHAQIGDALAAKYNQTFHNYFDPAVDRGQTFDGNIVKAEKLDAIPDGLKPSPQDDPTNPSVIAKNKRYQALVDDANSWDRQFTPTELRDRLRMNNAESTAYHAMTADAQYAADAAGRPGAQVAAEGVGLRKALYQGIDPYSDGKNIAESQGRYSDIITTRQHLERVENAIADQNTPSTLQHAVVGVSDLLGIATGRGAEIAQRRALEPDTLNAKITKAFAGYKGGPLPKIPDPPNLITPKPTPPSSDYTLKSPSGDSQFTVQRSLFGGDLGAYDQGADVGSKPNFQLQPTDPKTFDWQRELFPQTPIPTPAPKLQSGDIGNVSRPERPVLPPPVNP